MFCSKLPWATRSGKCGCTKRLVSLVPSSCIVKARVDSGEFSTGQRSLQVQEAISDVTKFGAMVGLKGFLPFRDAAHALENANDVSEGAPS